MANVHKVKVLVVNGDTALRQGLTRLLGQHPDIELVGHAISGRTAAPKIATYRPHLVLVDLEQNPADGLELLSHLQQQEQPPHRLVFAAAEAPPPTLPAAQFGAVEVVRRPVGLAGDALVERLVHEALPTVLRLAGHGSERRIAAGLPPLPATAPVQVAPHPPAHPPGTPPAAIVPPPVACASHAFAIVGIGVSTGGPKALTGMLPLLPADFPLPILVVQHMPPKFTASLAESLDKICKLRVAEAKDNDRIERGRILIAPGGRHMRAMRTEIGDIVRLSEDPLECSCRPSVDYLFRSLALVFGSKTLGVVMTGMGEDGWIGSRLVHKAGGRVLAQNEATSTVYGMPRGPIQEGIATPISLDHLAASMEQALRGAPCS